MDRLAIVRTVSKFTVWVSKHAGKWTVFSTLFALVGLYYSAMLYKNLRTDLEELLPENAQSVKDIRNVGNRIAGLNHLSLVIESSNKEAGRRFQKDVAEKLTSLPKSEVARVQYSIQEEKVFFEKNKALYIDVSDWEEINRYVRDRLRFEKKNKNPFALGLDDDEEDTEKSKAPEFDFNALKKKYESRASSYAHLPDGLFESEDGKTHIVLAFLPGKVTDLKVNEKLSDVAHQMVAELDPKTYAADMVVGFSGDVQNLVEEHHGLVKDLVTSFILVSILVAVFMFVFYRSFWAVVALNFSLFVGTAITFGLSYFIVGYLNANTAFLGSIVIGNGINFGIIYLARYLEIRSEGADPEHALARSTLFTAEATWTAAAAAGLSYLSLVLTDFRGFNQFGVIGGLGMLVCWISAFTVLPASLALFEKWGWVRVPAKERKAFFSKAFSKIVTVAHKPIFVLTFVSIVASGYYMSKLSSDTLESDFSKMRNKESMETGAGFWSKKVDAVFKRYLTPTLILTFDAKDTEKVAEQLEKIQKREGDSSQIAEFNRVDDYVPQDQPRKIRLIGEIKKKLTPKILARMGAEDKKLVDEMLPKEELTPLKLEDLPEGVLTHYREADGTLGRMVLVYPKLAGGEQTAGATGKEAGFWDGRKVIQFANEIREAVKFAEVGAVIAGQPPLSADMISAISKDGPKATLGAFVAVMLLVLLLFPKFILWRSILGALLLGVLWLGGFMGAFSMKINFLNFIALPITFGIGVDYAVNIFSRYRLDGAKQGIAKVLESTGGAVALCSLTTITGYSSLLLAGSQAFFSFGLIAVLGELTCLVAALVALPAVWMTFEKARQRRRAHSSQSGQMAQR